MEFEVAKCWLKFSDLNKMIVKIVQEKNYINWLELFNPWLYNVAPRLKEVICGIRNLNMSLCKP